LWETAGGRRLHQLQTGQAWLVQLAFSADGKSLLTLGAQALRQLDGSQGIAVWEVATGKCLRRGQGQPLTGLSGKGFVDIEEQTAAVSPGLKYLAFQRRDDSGILRIHVRDLETGKELARIERGGFGGMHTLGFSADEKTLLWDHYPADDVVFSDVLTGKELRRLGAHRPLEGNDRSDAALAVALSADGKTLSVCRMSHALECWDVASGKPTYPVGRPTAAQLEQWFADWVGAFVRPALAFSPDGKELVCSLGGPTLRRFHTNTGEETPGADPAHRAPVSTLALFADGKSLCTHGGGDPARSWDWTTGKETTQPGVPAGATHAAFAARGRFAFAVGNQVTLHGAAGPKTWRTAAGEWPPLVALALSPDGSLLATRSFDYPEVRLWDANGKSRYTLGRPGDGPDFIADGLREAAGVVTPDVVFSPDGRRLAGAGPRRQLCLW
jgi:WD40 repeat protein